MDLVQILAELAVAAARQAEVAKLTQTRQHIETLYQKREAGYLKEEQDWEQFVQNAQSILETAAKEWNELRVKAQSALEQADQDQLRFRNLAIAKEQQRLQEHIERWKRDLEDLRSRGPSIDGEVLLDRIQLVLDFAGFIPVLGAGPDIINTMISVGRGNWGDAAINAIAIIPFWGDGAKAGKMLAKAGREGLQHVDEVAEVVSAVAKKADDAADELIDNMDTVQKNMGDDVGELFDGEVLTRILDNHLKNGGSVMRGDEAARILKSIGAQAAYLPKAGGPGTLIIGSNATRLQIVEELLHHGQYKRLGYPLLNSTQSMFTSVRVEIEAQNILLKLAQRKGWTEAEIDLIIRNRDAWTARLEELIRRFGNGY